MGTLVQRDDPVLNRKVTENLVVIERDKITSRKLQLFIRFMTINTQLIVQLLKVKEESLIESL